MTAEPADIIHVADDDEDEPQKDTGREGMTPTVSRSFTRRVSSSKMSRAPLAIVSQEQGGSS